MNAHVNRTLLLAGGGTGGHVYPAVAVADAWCARGPGHHAVFVGSARGLEARVVPELGYEFIAAPARRLKNASPVERARSLATMPGAVLKGRSLLGQIQPSVVLGVGGYVSGPVVLAAATRRLPIALAEQNSIPGLTNRMLARVARRVYTAFPDAAEHFPSGRARLLGNPVRQGVLDAARGAPVPGQSEPLHVVIIGGSQGAGTLNEQVPKALGELARHGLKLTVHHLAGPGRDEPVRALYATAGLSAEVAGYLDEPGQALAAADLVVARAGATTVAELACLGRPALFIPFPHAADDHQAANARALVQAGAAAMLRESELTEGVLTRRLGELLGDRAGLTAMGEAARDLGRPEAASAIAADLAELAAEVRR